MSQYSLLEVCIRQKVVKYENTLFQSNKRSGLAIQRALEQIMVANCTFDATVTDQSIDFEPSGHDGPTNLLIHGCIINHTNATPAALPDCASTDIR